MSALVRYFCDQTGPHDWWCIACDVNARAMCAEECVECHGPDSCPSLGRDCRMGVPRPPRTPRKVVYSAQFIDSMLDLMFGEAFRDLDWAGGD